jgi:D-amino-acid dehydrogenase
VAQVAIIGAGIIGLATAYELISRGTSVVLVDPRSPGSAATSGNTGWIVPALSGPVPAPGLPAQVLRWMMQRDSPFRIDLRRAPEFAFWLYRFWRHCNPVSYQRGLQAMGRLNCAAYESLQRWQDSGLEFEYSRQGVLFVARDPHHIEHLVTDMDSLATYGFQPVDWVTQALLHDLEPALSPNIDCGVLAHREQHVRPESLVTALLQALSDGSATFVEASVDGKVVIEDGCVTGMCAGVHQVDADAFVIAAGAWTGRLGRDFGLNLPIISGKGYSITVTEPELQLQQPLYLADAKVACTPFKGANRFAGMMDLTGPDESIDPSRLTTMMSALDTYLPRWNRGKRRIAWSGLRPITPDGLPLIGKAPGLENVYIAGGHGMLGMTLAPVTGEIIADLIVAGDSSFDVTPFDPGRF